MVIQISKKKIWSASIMYYNTIIYIIYIIYYNYIIYI